MTRFIRFFPVFAALLATVNLSAQEGPDTILLNGKIVTVDDYFSIQEAVAIGGERIVAVGTDAEIRALAAAGVIGREPTLTTA